MRIAICWLATTVLLGGALAQADTYIPLDFSSQYNIGRDYFMNGHTYPMGDTELGGVPFTLSRGNLIGWNAHLAVGEGPHVLSIPVNAYGAREVHTLINTFWGQPGPASYLAIEFYGSQGAFARYELVGNDDIRDFSQGNYTNAINGVSTVEVFNNGLGQRLDKQTFDLPEVFEGQVLSEIRLIDSGATDFQRAFVFGATVLVPEPASVLTLLGGLAAAMMRRRPA